MRRALILIVVALVACTDGGSAEPSPAPTQTATVTAAPTTAPPSPSPTPSPTESEQRVVLDQAGLGLAQFGDGPSDVVEALSSRYGTPEEDSNWVPAQGGNFGICPGEVVRRVRWGQVSVLFTDGATGYGAAGSRHLFSYWVSAQGDDPGAELGHGPQTAEGIGVGSTVADVRAAYGSAEDYEDEIGGPRLLIAGDGERDLLLYVSDLTDSGVIESLSAGEGCGE